VFDAAGVCSSELGKTFDVGNERNAVVPGGIDDGVECLLPPAILVADFLAHIVASMLEGTLEAKAVRRPSGLPACRNQRVVGHGRLGRGS
jgi:hypothetical protein